MTYILTLLAMLATLTLSAADTSTEQAQPLPPEQGQGLGGYVAEAPLPEGWPGVAQPGVVELALLPAHRAAQAGGFWTLFAHIRQNRIPMTAPVVMEMDDPAMVTGADREGTRTTMIAMAFLYPDADTKAGHLSPAVVIVDHSEQWVLRLAHRGAMDAQTFARLSRQLREESMDRQLKVTGAPRLFGYNSPMLPVLQRTHEVVLPVVLMDE